MSVSLVGFECVCKRTERLKVTLLDGNMRIIVLCFVYFISSKYKEYVQKNNNMQFMEIPYRMFLYGLYQYVTIRPNCSKQPELRI